MKVRDTTFVRTRGALVYSDADNPGTQTLLVGCRGSANHIAIDVQNHNGGAGADHRVHLTDGALPSRLPAFESRQEL